MAVGTSPYATGGASSVGTDPIRVLIADDEPALRVALADLLAHDDEVVLIGSAGDADEAIQLAVDRAPRRRPGRREDARRRRAPRGPRDHAGIPRHPGHRPFGLRGSSHRPRDAAGRCRRLSGEGHRRRGDPGFDPEGHGRGCQPLVGGDRRHRPRALPAAAPGRRGAGGARLPAAPRSSDSWRARTSRWSSSPSSSSPPAPRWGSRRSLASTPCPFALPTSGSPRR